MPEIMQVRYARFTGALVAECPRCHTVCAYWDVEDLDEDDNLLCFCEDAEIEHRNAVAVVDYEPSTCPVCDSPESHNHTAAEYDDALGTYPGRDPETGEPR